MKYVLIPYLCATRTNAQATPWLVSPVPVFAASMLGHALADDLGGTAKGVAYIHHRAELIDECGLPESSERRRFPNQHRGTSFINKVDYNGGGSKPVLSLQPTYTAHLVASLIVALEGCDPSEQQVRERLLGRALAGGKITDHERIHVFDTKEAALEAVRGGFVTVDSSHLLGQANEHGETDLLNNFIKQTHERRKADDNTPLPWRTGVVLGYTAVTEFRHRRNVRDQLPLAFAEPMVGLVDLISIRQLRQSNQDIPLWQWGWPTQNIFLIQQGVTP